MPSDIEPSAKSKGPNWALRGAMLLIGAGALALLYVLFAASSKPASQDGYARFARGEMAQLQVMADAPPMPAETPLTGAGAEPAYLSQFEGEVVVLNLWATWCAPCVEEMPTLGALQRRFGDRLRVVPVSVDSVPDTAKAQAELTRLAGPDLPFLMDSSRAILFSLRAAGMPTTIVYDAHGREVARLAGGADWASPEAIAFFEAVLAEP